MRALGRWTLTAVGVAALLVGGFIAERRIDSARDNRALFSWALDTSYLAVDQAGGGWVTMVEGGEALMGHLSPTGLERRQLLEPRDATWYYPSTLTSLGAGGVAYSAVARTKRGFVGWVGLVGHGAPRSRELDPADALFVDGAGTLTGIVPCHTTSTVDSVDDWGNDSSRCLVAVPMEGELGPRQPLCDDCRVLAARATGSTLRAWLLREQRRHVLIAYDAPGPPREIASIDGRDGSVFVNAVSLAVDGSSVVVGAFNGSLVTGGRTIPNEAGSDAFVASYDPNGQVRFTRVFGSSAEERALGVGLLTDGIIRVLLSSHSDVAPRWEERVLRGRIATTEAIELMDLDSAGGVQSRRRYAVARPEAERRRPPLLAGGDHDVALLVLSSSEGGPLLDARRPSTTSYLVVGLAPR